MAACPELVPPRDVGSLDVADQRHVAVDRPAERLAIEDGVVAVIEETEVRPGQAAQQLEGAFAVLQQRIGPFELPVHHFDQQLERQVGNRIGGPQQRFPGDGQLILEGHAGAAVSRQHHQLRAAELHRHLRRLSHPPGEFGMRGRVGELALVAPILDAERFEPGPGVAQRSTEFGKRLIPPVPDFHRREACRGRGPHPLGERALGFGESQLDRDGKIDHFRRTASTTVRPAFSAATGSLAASSSSSTVSLPGVASIASDQAFQSTMPAPKSAM